MGYFDGKALHDEIQCQDHAEAVFNPHHGALFAGKRSGANSNALARGDVSVGLGAAMTHTGAECIDFVVGDGGWFSIEAAYNRDDPRHFQNADAISLSDIDEQIAGEERKLDLGPRAIIPPPIGSIERQKMRDIALIEMLGDAFFVAVRGVNSKPAHDWGIDSTCGGVDAGAGWKKRRSPVEQDSTLRYGLGD